MLHGIMHNQSMCEWVHAWRPMVSQGSEWKQFVPNVNVDISISKLHLINCWRMKFYLIYRACTKFCWQLLLLTFAFRHVNLASSPPSTGHNSYQKHNWFDLDNNQYILMLQLLFIRSNRGRRKVILSISFTHCPQQKSTIFRLKWYAI